MLHEPYGESQQAFGHLDGLFAKNPEARDFLAQAILDSVTVMMAVLDTNGRVHIVNEAWRRQARESCSPDQLTRAGIGMNYLDVCKHAQGASAEEAPEAFAGIEAVLGGRQSSFTLEYPCFSPARQSWYLMSVTPLPGNAGAVVAHIDITERKQLEQQKDIFISMASHELRAPLTALKGLTQLEKKKSEKRGLSESLRFLTKMEKHIDQLTKLVTELFDAAKMQAGRLDYVKEPLDLDALINEIVETAQLTSPGHRLTIHGASHATISGDRDKLGQAFTNLLSNAIKYSPQADYVDISLETVQDGAFVRIQDAGIGIPKERQDRLFERFYRVDTSKQNYVPGLGLGLYIAHEIIKHHGGEITVSSEEGKGSIFSVSLPLHVSAT
ncbi:hypothetical protein KSC_006140 [Ktedonobacter sp. SOSP1-52]|uniref:ATP-binding protein n=1 Tax=Ktedonobacter sp. SOSP1-52 TaxID=2778366 RepID=UPI0019158331|nr:ATP-binding protein [Ktedonobacter sp. SOSP1-52]GHO61722.1 hypothetical protein KSC_006140 [Ktedonobacter sp. SOSP1-52]